MANRQLLVFKLNNEDFGIDITHVDSIIPKKDIIKVPNTPDFIEGLLSLRGKVYTVFNLRKKFKFPDKEFDENTKIIIINITSSKYAFIADEVNEIIKLEDENIEPPPDSIVSLNHKYITGIARIGERIIIVFDLSEALSLVDDEVIEKKL